MAARTRARKPRKKGLEGRRAGLVPLFPRLTTRGRIYTNTREAATEAPRWFASAGDRGTRRGDWTFLGGDVIESRHVRRAHPRRTFAGRGPPGRRHESRPPQSRDPPPRARERAHRRV